MNKYQNLNVWKYQKGCWTKLRKIFSRQAMRWLIMNKNIPNFCFFFRVWGRGWREDFFGIGVLFPYMFFESYSHFQNVPNTFPMFFMYPFLLHMICRLLFPFVIPNIPMQTPWWSQITPHFIPYSLPKILLL